MARPVRPAPPPLSDGPHGGPGGGRGGSNAASGAGGAVHQGSIPARLAPLWAPLGAGSPHPMAPEHRGDVAAPADPAAIRARDS